MDHKLQLIPGKPDEKKSTILQGKAPFIKGGGDNNYLCGNCSNILIEQVAKRQVSGMVLLCPKCGSYNGI